VKGPLRIRSGGNRQFETGRSREGAAAAAAADGSAWDDTDDDGALCGSSEDDDSRGDKDGKKGHEDDDANRPDGMDSEDWAFEKVLRRVKSGKPLNPVKIPVRKLDEVVPGEFCRLSI